MVTLGALVGGHGEREKGIAMMREAMRLNPYHPEWYWITLARLLYCNRQYEEAVDILKPRQRNAFYALCRLAAALAQLRRRDKAAEVVAEILRQRPQFRISQYRPNYWGPGNHGATRKTHKGGPAGIAAGREEITAPLPNPPVP